MQWGCILNVLPQPKQSVRFGGKFVYHDKKKELYSASLKGQIKSRFEASGSPMLTAKHIKMDVIFIFPYTQQQLKGKHNKLRMGVRPDRVNLLKPLEDALNGIVIPDDSVFCEGDIRKERWRDSEGAIHVLLTEMDEIIE